MALDPDAPKPSRAVVPLSDDRRAHRRMQIDLPVLIETEARSATGRCVDLGPGGVRVQVDLPLAEGAEVAVYLELPIGFAVECRAVVLRVDGSIVALRFVDPPREAVVAIRGFCRISSTSVPRLAG